MKVLKTLFILCTFLLTSTVFAHDVLKSLSKEQLTQVQQNLESKGYLKIGEVVYGVYDAKTEVAFDTYQVDREKSFLEQNNSNQNEQATKTQVIVEKKVSFLSWLWESLKRIFK